MRWPDFRRARHYGRTSKDRLSLLGVGICAALLLPLLVLDLGLLVQLVLGGGDATVPTDWILGPWISGRIVAWPFFGDERVCLYALLGFGVVVGAIEVCALWLLNRAVHRAALDVVVRFHGEIHRQAFRLGASDLLGGRRSPPEQLAGEATEVLRRGLVRWWSAVPYAVVAFGSLVLMALAVNVWLGLVVLLAVLLVRQISGGYATRGASRHAAWACEAATAREHLLENLRLTPLATGYGLPDAPGRSFREMLATYRRAQLSAEYCRASEGPVLLLLTLLAAAYVLLVIGLSRYVTVAGTVVLTTSMIGAYFPAARLERLRGSLGVANDAAAELFAYLRREPAVREVDNAIAIDRIRDSIHLEHVTLADSQGAKLLDHADLSIQARQRTGILASDPAAAMALAGLLVRLYDPAAGRVLFDNRDIATATFETVRGQALLVPADGMLFAGTVGENISCGDAAFTLLQITDAAKRARAHHFVADLPHGFGTMIGGGGADLDCGQAFRVGLARALLRDPSLLIVVEPGEEFDEATAVQLDEALRSASADRTLIVIPSRLATLRSMDLVILLHEGKVVAQGPHASLLRSSELYRHLNYVRFNAYRHLR